MWSTVLRSALLALCLMLQLPHSFYGIDEPTEPGILVPEVEEPQATDVTFQPNTVSNQVKPMSYILHLRFYGGKTWEAEWQPELPALVITNIDKKKMIIKSISLSEIRSISVAHWKPVRTSAALYEFQPDDITIRLKDEKIYKADSLPVIHTLSLKIDNQDRTVYSIFYDQWIPGQTGVYRWKNSKAGDFAYNFSHPVEGVVIEIDFPDLPVKDRAE